MTLIPALPVLSCDASKLIASFPSDTCTPHGTLQNRTGLLSYTSFFASQALIAYTSEVLLPS